MRVMVRAGDGGGDVAVAAAGAHADGGGDGGDVDAAAAAVGGDGGG